MAYPATVTILLASILPATGWAMAETAPAPSEANSLAPSPKKIARYAGRLISRYDTDGSGILNRAEWGRMQGRPAVMDRDQDGQVTVAEIILHIREYALYRRLGYSSPRGQVDPMDKSDLSSPDYTGSVEEPTDRLNVQNTSKDKSSDSNTGSASRRAGKHPNAPFHVPAKLRPNNLPNWFAQRDRNGDGQLSLAEFAPANSRELVTSFQRLDTNQDGLLTPQEATAPKQPEPKQPEQPPSEPTSGTG
jgi:hypothetical protein